MLKYLIVGAGPAGLQLAYYFQRAGISYQILEAGSSPGTFFKTFPRHRKLISINKIYTGFDDVEINMRWDWNSLLSDDPRLLFKNYSREYFPSADSMVRYLEDFATFNDLSIQLGTRVCRISRGKEGFLVEDEHDQQWSCQRVIVATGLSRPFLPEVPGLEHAECYNDMPLDPEEFAGQRVLIVGKGNSAFETADHLLAHASLLHLVSPNPLKLAWNTHFVGHLRAVNNNLLDTYQLKSQNAILDAKIENIERAGEKYHVTFSYAHAHGEVETLSYDRLITCAGFRFDTSIFDETCVPETVIDDRFPNQTSQWESVNVPGLYFAGVVTQMRDFKKSTSGFIHGFRYNSQALFRILSKQFHDADWPSHIIPADAESLAKAVIGRINRTSGLWQQFGFLGDLILVDKQAGSARYYQEVPVHYFLDGGFGEQDLAYVVTLEYGSNHRGDVLSATRIARDDVDRSQESQFLHPVIRRFETMEEASSHHVIEDLESHWVEPVHTEPLKSFFDETLPAPRPAAARMGGAQAVDEAVG